MTLEAQVTEIINRDQDPEGSHFEEDLLMVELLEEYLPLELRTVFDRLKAAELTRWYA